MVGFEPTTAGATVRSSTTELHPPRRKDYSIHCDPFPDDGNTGDAPGLYKIRASHTLVAVRTGRKLVRTALIHLAAAIHHATVRLPAAGGWRRSMAALAYGKGRELFLQLCGVALGALRSLLAEEDRLKPVTAIFAKVFENRHTCSRSSQRRAALAHII